jgi:RNA ligase (TIGR02306 family)
MSSSTVRVRRIEVLPHPNADQLELARVDEYRSIVRKGQFRTGDLVAYIPEASLVPPPVLEELKLTGKLSGPDKNRVKAVRLRGELSQGLVLPARPRWHEGQDVTEELGITKWSPPVPVHMGGTLERAPEGWHGYTDIEDLKRFPGILVPGEEVVATEKVHGTCTLLGILGGRAAMSSKGYGAGGKVIVEDGKNLYWRVARRLQLFERLSGLGDLMLFGETFGAGVQDLEYGIPRDEPSYFAFDLAIGGRYLDYDELVRVCSERGVPLAALLYRGPFGPECLAHTSGKETMSKKSLHVREGIVIRPVKERCDPALGRVILKSVNPDYLVRGGEATEYE